VPDVPRCIARLTTPGSARSTGTALRCSVPGSAGGHRCPTSYRRWSRSASCPSRSLTRPWAAACRLGAGPGEVGRDRCLSQWCVEGSLPSRSEHARQAPRADRWFYAAPYEPPRTPEPERHIDVQRPGEPVGIDCFYVGRLKGTEGAIWQLTAIDIASSYAWADLVICKQGNPTAAQTSRLAQRVAREPKSAGWRPERLRSDNASPQTSSTVPERWRRDEPHLSAHLGGCPG
jgi:hypothetical protein